MTWEIALGIFALIGFSISIGKIIENNTRAMTELKCGIDNLKAALPEMKEQLNDHEHRITIIEKK